MAVLDSLSAEDRQLLQSYMPGGEKYEPAMNTEMSMMQVVDRLNELRAMHAFSEYSQAIGTAIKYIELTSNLEGLTLEYVGIDSKGRPTFITVGPFYNDNTRAFFCDKKHRFGKDVLQSLVLDLYQQEPKCKESIVLKGRRFHSDPVGTHFKIARIHKAKYAKQQQI